MNDTSIDNLQVNLRQAASGLDALPSMPFIAQKLLTLKLDTEEGIRMLLVLIEQDPLISAKIIGLANSSSVGASRQIKTVRDASMLLGMKRVQSVSTGIAIMTMMSKVSTGKFNMKDLWLHSFGIAFAMLGIVRFIPARVRPNDDHIFLAGMLHDIGYLVLAFLDVSRSDRLHTRLSIEHDRPALEVEREILGICHDELGAELAQHWNLPEEVVSVLRYHHTPYLPEAAGLPLARMIHIAEKLLPSFGLNEYVTPGVSDEEWGKLGISPSKAEEVRESVQEQAEQAIQFAGSFG